MRTSIWGSFGMTSPVREFLDEKIIDLYYYIVEKFASQLLRFAALHLSG
jgi:hypothetical protein